MTSWYGQGLVSQYVVRELPHDAAKQVEKIQHLSTTFSRP